MLRYQDSGESPEDERLPIGPEVDPTPRPLPARIPSRGAAVTA
jgi:hypothetical protein